VNAAAFYCVCDERYFLGAVAMINSLRLHGHDEPVYLLDSGMTAEQRELAGAAATIVDPPFEAPAFLLKTVAPLLHPAEVRVMIDADVIVTRPLGELIERAGEGRVVAFENHEDRFVPEWGELLELGSVRRQPYLCSAFVAMGADPGDEVLRLMDDRQRRAEYERSFWSVNVLNEPIPDYPLLYLDQDVFNAVLASRVDPDLVVGLDRRLTALTPFDDLELVDAELPRCRYRDGVEPYLLHHILPGKPWLEPMPDGVYARLLRRLLVGQGLAIEVPERAVPMRLRNGPVAALERRRSHLAVRLRWEIGVRLARWRERLRSAGPRGATTR
jgi:hypothetical protein